MMKAKRALALGLAAAMCATALSACGKGGNGGTGAADGETIKIGLNYELSGDVGQYGQSCAQGIRLAIEEINAAGGVLDKQIELVEIDNASKNEEAKSAAIRLATKENVSLILGPATSGAVKATTAVATQYKVPVITCSATADDITVQNGKLNPYTYRICYNDTFQGTMMGNFATKDLNVKKAVVLVDSSNDYSAGLGNAFKESFTSKGGTIVDEQTYNAKDTDFKAILTNLKGKEFDAIYLTGYYEAVALIIKQAREIGITQPFLGADGYDAPKLPEIAGSALSNVYFTNHYSSGDTAAEVQDFIKKFREKYDKDPDGFNALGYDMAKFAAGAIKRAGSADREKINQALAETKDYPAVTGKFSIDQNHNPIKATVIIEYKEGKQTFRTKMSAE